MPGTPQRPAPEREHVTVAWDPGSGDLDRRIHVKPAADLTHTDIVQVLTEPHADLRADVK